MNTTNLKAGFEGGLRAALQFEDVVQMSLGPDERLIFATQVDRERPWCREGTCISSIDLRQGLSVKQLTHCAGQSHLFAFALLADYLLVRKLDKAVGSKMSSSWCGIRLEDGAETKIPVEGSAVTVVPSQVVILEDEGERPEDEFACLPTPGQASTHPISHAVIHSNLTATELQGTDAYIQSASVSGGELHIQMTSRHYLTEDIVTWEQVHDLGTGRCISQSKPTKWESQGQTRQQQQGNLIATLYKGVLSFKDSPSGQLLADPRPSGSQTPLVAFELLSDLLITLDRDHVLTVWSA